MLVNERIQMKYKSLVIELNLRFPILFQSESFEKNELEIYSPGPHIVYGETIVPYVKNLLRDEKNPVELHQVFSFFEDIAQSEDEETRNLLQVTILESLWDEKEIYEKSQNYMFPATKQINNLIGTYLRIPCE